MNLLVCLALLSSPTIDPLPERDRPIVLGGHEYILDAVAGDWGWYRLERGNLRDGVRVIRHARVQNRLTIAKLELTASIDRPHWATARLRYIAQAERMRIEREKARARREWEIRKWKLLLDQLKCMGANGKRGG